MLPFSGKSPKELSTPETLEIEVNNLDSPTEKILSPLDAAFSDDDDEEKKGWSAALF